MQLLEALPKLISWAIPLIILAVIILPQAIRILREYERGVIFRLGKLLGAKGPGLIFLIPIVDPSEDRHVWIHFVFGCDVNEAVIFNVEIRSAEIQFFPRIHELCFHGRAKPLPPKIRSRDVNFIARAARQTRALWLANVTRRSFFRVEIGIAGGKNKIGNRLHA